MNTVYAVVSVHEWGDLQFTSNHPGVSAMVEMATTLAPIPGSTGFLPIFSTLEEAQAFARTVSATGILSIEQREK